MVCIMNDVDLAGAHGIVVRVSGCTAHRALGSDTVKRRAPRKVWFAAMHVTRVHERGSDR